MTSQCNNALGTDLHVCEHPVEELPPYAITDFPPYTILRVCVTVIAPYFLGIYLVQIQNCTDTNVLIQELTTYYLNSMGMLTQSNQTTYPYLRGSQSIISSLKNTNYSLRSAFRFGSGVCSAQLPTNFRSWAQNLLTPRVVCFISGRLQ